MVVPDVLEGEVHEAAAAAVVAILGRAVDEVLLGEGDELARLAEVLPLERARGGEGPAGAALALVLDRGHRALRPPVDLGGRLEVVRGDEGGSHAGNLVLFGVQDFILISATSCQVWVRHQLSSPSKFG